MKPTMHEEQNNFKSFFEKWLSQQSQNLQRLNKIAVEHNHNEAYILVPQVLKHYEAYYEVKSKWAEHNILAVMSPPWKSTLEHAFLWLGGWRPSMGFHLLYAKIGAQLEAHLARGGLRAATDDLSDLSQRQVSFVNMLQAEAIKQEKHIAHKMAKVQETMADSTMVELSHVVTNAMRNNNNGDLHDHDEVVESSIEEKEENFKEILGKADELRLGTLKNITKILTPIQAVHFLIAAAELHLKIHDWGRKKDCFGQVMVW